MIPRKGFRQELLMVHRTKTALVPFAEGFEEIEFVTIVDVLRRAGIEVTTASTQSGMVRGSRGISMAADRSIAGVDATAYDAVILPGGMKNAQTLATDQECQRVIREARHQDRIVAAICAAPIALESA